MSRREWAEHLIRRGRAVGEPPRYGSREWCALADADSRKVAAVVLAAECWHDHVTRLPERLHDELTAMQQVQQADDEAQFAHVAGRVRRLASVPEFAEVKRRWSA